MSFNPLAIITIPKLLPWLPKSPSVVELGNQSFSPTAEALEKILLYLDNGKDAEVGRLLRQWKDSPISALADKTAQFYSAYGFSSYTAIDINSRYGSKIMDLNEDLGECNGYKETFDLVTNIGTGEHVFNQLQVFGNSHRLVKKGGLVLCILPTLNWFNHGFYNFNPGFFVDVAKANRYELLRLTLGNRWGDELEADLQPHTHSQNDAPRALIIERLAGLFRRKFGETRAQPWLNALAHAARIRELERKPLKSLTLAQLASYLPPACGYPAQPLALGLMQLMRSEQRRIGSVFPITGNVFVTAVFRKTIDAPFAMPIQTMYENDVETPALIERYRQ